MTVGIRRASNNNIGIISDDTIRDQLRTDGFPVIGGKLVSTRKSCIHYELPPEASASHSGQLSRDDQHHELANSEHLHVYGAGRPLIRGMRVSLHPTS